MNFDRTQTSDADRVLHPVGASAFLSAYYTERCGKFRLASDIDPDALLSMEAVEATLSMPGVFETLSIALRAPGAPDPSFAHSLPEITDALSRGHGLQIAHYDRILPQDHMLARVYRALGQLLRAPCHGMTVFFSPPGAVLPTHNDPFEIFTLQLQGRKAWQTYGFASPDAGTRVSLPADGPTETFYLERGDLFYTPKGMVHDVVPGKGHSLSVAMIYRPASWAYLAEELYRQVSKDPTFWRSLPPEPVAKGFEYRKARLHAAIDELDTQALVRLVEASRSAVHSDTQSYVLTKVLRVDEITRSTQLKTRANAGLHLIERDGETLLYSANDTPIRIPAAGKEAVERMLAFDASFTPDDVSDTLSTPSKLALVRKLARRGVLEIL